ncbi:MAG TPA: AMP-binding protein [Solirubrobacteraceae bacterium]|nr:AMP-binding protein [Solirubrobacteraceae bacterium]
MSFLWAGLERRDDRPDVLRCWDGSRYVRWSWDDWRAASARAAARLRAEGVRPGDRVACILANSPQSCALVLGVWMLGGCVVSLPTRARSMDHQAYLRLIDGIIDQANPSLTLVPDPKLAIAVSDNRARVYLHDAVVDLSDRSTPSWAITPVAPPEGVADAFIQYSSGSTEAPKGCILSAEAIAAQLIRLSEALQIDAARDVGVFWLPLSHDMGFFGALMLAFAAGHRLVLGTPERFISRPITWLEDYATFAGTLSATPPFGLAVATRLAQQLPVPSFTFGRLVVGAERVQADMLRSAAVAFGPTCLPWSALLPAYGLAEATLAVTMTPLGHGPEIRTVAGRSLGVGDVVPTDAGNDAAREIVSVGRPLRDITVTLADDARDVGELVVDSPSLMSGYVARPRRDSGVGMATGDLGFCADGQVFVTGRADDMLVVGGRNVYAQDLEGALSQVAEVRLGMSVVVAEREGYGLVLICELPRLHRAPHVVADEVRGAAVRAAGVAIRRCLFVKPGTLPKTPSGKVQRFLCQELLAAPPSGSIHV